MDSLLNSAPSVTSVDRRLIELIEDAARRLKEGQSVNLEQVVAEHPSHADALRELLPTLTALMGLADDETASQSRSGGQLGRYQLMAKLGRGGMGAVYMALHTDLQKVVALKVLHNRRIGDPQAVARFKREMIAAGRFDHPRLVRALDAGEESGTQFLVMDYIDGVDLAEMVRRRGPLPIADACQIIKQAAEGLQHVHEGGLIHRDVKPSNLMINRAGEVKILDLGLARLHDGADVFQTDLTGAGHLIGTVDYMAPEQGDDGRTADGRVDVYSLGATLFQLLAGRPPFGGDECNTPLKKLMAIATLPAPSVREFRADVPAALDQLMRRMLSKDPGDRVASAAEVASSLAPFVKESDLLGLIRGVQPAAGVETNDGESGPAALSTSSDRATGTSDQQPMRAALAGASDGRRSRGRWLWIALGSAGWVAAAGLILVIRDRDGAERARLKVAAGDRIEIAEDAGEAVKPVVKPAVTPVEQPAAEPAVNKPPESQKAARPKVVARTPTEKFTLFAPGKDGAGPLAEFLGKAHPKGAVTTAKNLRELPDDGGVLLVVMDKESFTQIGSYSPDALKHRRVVGIGYGAAQLFDELGLEINGGACAHGVIGEPRLTVLDNGLVDRAKFESPFFVFNPPVLDEKNFHNDFFFGVYVGDKKPERRQNIDVIALQTRDRNYAPVAQQGRHVLVCIDAPTDKWSQDLLRLVDAVGVGLDSRE